jgi:hypothetical protein
MPRFVILEHDHPELHWDLMLESGATLRTWRLLQPLRAPGETISAVALSDHRLHYLDYEGPVSGGRGTVKRWDAGEYAPIDSEPGDALHFLLDGARVRGHIRVAPHGANAWTVEWLSVKNS